MEKQNFNPNIEAVVSIRHYAMAASNNWSSMKSLSTLIKSDIDRASEMVKVYGSEDTKRIWTTEMIRYNSARAQLQEIMSHVVSKIKQKSADNLVGIWNQYHEHTARIESSYDQLKKIGRRCLPENKVGEWKQLWGSIDSGHTKMKNEAEASSIQLGLIEQCDPKEVNELTDTILKHIPLKYTLEEAHKYTDEYMEAYENLKKEATQKKNIWDRFLDLLAGGVQQTPAQQVMLQRWVEGEKGDTH